jgi:hypothetical protein
MGSSLSPLVANSFLSYFEHKYIDTCPVTFKPVFYRRYLDDTFAIFKSQDQALQFFNYINTKHDSLTFTMESEDNGILPFLDVSVRKVQNGFTTSVFRKKTFTGLGTNFFSNIYIGYKISSIMSLINRAYKISSNFNIFHVELNFLKSFAISNKFPGFMFDSFVKTILNRQLVVNQIVPTVPKLNIYLNLPDIGYLNDKLKQDMQNVIEKYFYQIRPQFYFKNNFRIGTFFRIKESVEDARVTSYIYKYLCDCCQQSYLGSSSLQSFVRCSQHSGVSFRTGRPYTTLSKSAIRDHCNSCNHLFKLSNFSILAKSHDNRELRVLESLYILTDKPELNNDQSSVKLHIAPSF